MALHVLTDGDVRLVGGVIKLKDLLQLSDRYLRHGRPAQWIPAAGPGCKQCGLPEF